MSIDSFQLNDHMKPKFYVRKVAILEMVWAVQDKNTIS